MKPIGRIVITIISIIVATFFLGLLSMGYDTMSRPKGAIFGLLSVAIIVGIPYLSWWVTGRIGRPEIAGDTTRDER